MIRTSPLLSGTLLKRHGDEGQESYALLDNKLPTLQSAEEYYFSFLFFIRSVKSLG